MHTICGYPVKLKWLKVIKVGNYEGWLMLTNSASRSPTPRQSKIAKEHLNQTKKNLGLTKAKAVPLETCNTFHLHGKKVCNEYT
jgi:hypothetical protein